MYKHLDSYGARLRDELADLFARHELPVHMTGAGSIVDWYFTSGPITDYRSTLHTDLRLKAELGALMRKHGLFGGAGRFSSTTHHGEAELDYTLEAVEAGLREIGERGRLRSDRDTAGPEAETVEIRGATEGDVAEIVDLAATVFVTESRPRYASQHYEDSSYKTHQSRVCVVDGKIVSHVRVSERAMRIGSKVVKLGGIGMVATLEEHRHRGYASALMQDAVDYMRDRGYDLGMLLTSIQPFYAQFGWAAFPQTTFELELRGKKSFESSPWTVRPFDEDRDLPQVIQVYNDHNRERSGTIARTEQHWRDSYARQVGLPPTLVAERDGAIGAYANVELGDGSGRGSTDAFLSTYYPNVRGGRLPVRLP